MKHPRWNIIPDWRFFLRDKRSVSGFLVGLMIMPIMGILGGLVVDYGVLLSAKESLQANVNAAAFYGAYTWDQPNNTYSTAETAAQGWASSHPVANVSISGTPVTTVSCNTSWTNAGLPNCNASASPPTYNIMTVTETGAVADYFMRIFGIGPTTISATAHVAKGGGQGANVMFILDSTASMTSDTDKGCGVPSSISTNPTKYQCALYGVQLVLQQLESSGDYAGLMIFPGQSKIFNFTSACSKSAPATMSPTPYESSTIYYQMYANSTATPTTTNTYQFANGPNYNDGSGNLVDTASIVYAVGDFTGTIVYPCLQAKGGEGTFYAEAITAAQTALNNIKTNVGAAKNSENVIVFLSDGDASASSSQFASGKSSSASNECQQGVTAAATAKSAGTTIYSIAYDSLTSGSCSTDSGIQACTAMQDISTNTTTGAPSASADFFSVESSSGGGGNCPSNNQVSLSTAFSDIGSAISKPRLVPSS